jgi:nitrogen PTS system EIIA component
VHFGATLRMLRLDAGIGLTELARRVGVSPAYLSRVEHGHDAPPTPDRIAAIARALELSPVVLLEIAQGAGAALASYLERVPEASALFMEMAARELGPAEIAKIKELMDRVVPRRTRDEVPARLLELLSPDRVMLRAICHDVEDMMALAATRLCPDREDARALIAQLAAREELASSMMGSGVIVPHAIVPGRASAAALVTVTRPIRTRTPDGEGIRVCIVLVEPNSDRRHLQRLAHVARLAARGLADTVAQARTARQLLEALASLDVS